LVVNADISSQSMSVRVNGWPSGSWRISSARAGYHTPRGSYRVTRTAAVYFSKKYDNSPMPHSVFFYGGYAIHGTYHVGALGRPASHGCIRVSPANAAKLYALVREYGAARTRITITD
jgi:lipoprotein-anchoring transpeptidase ErfK/SrfK